ncbi:MAG: S1 family peptidase [Myxococcota bacterium]|jgi:V8-like Glu-specific endopeptidase|nr:S1 family peptidase [Myxococcota bacterium]
MVPDVSRTPGSAHRVPSSRHVDRRRAGTTRALLGGLAVFFGLAPAHAQDVGSIEQPAILGNDDRQQWFESGSLQSVVQASTVMLVPASSIGSGNEIRSRTTRSARHSLCPDEAFACEEVLGSCSGTLIDGHTVVTAGHCFSSLASIRAGGSCSGTAVVFNWRMESGDRRAQVLRSRDVYYCHEMLAAHYRPGTLEPDFAVFTIKRDRNGSAATPVGAPYRPAAISTTRRSSGTVYTVGHPSGIPVKVSPGSLVSFSGASGQIRFGTEGADVFPGNSGGGTFFGSTLIGVVTNAPDAPGESREFYPRDDAAGCNREVRLLRGTNSHMWLAPVIEALCNPSHPHHLVTRPTHLCGTAAPVAPGPGGTTPPGTPTFPSTVECRAGHGDPSGAALFLLAIGAWIARRPRRARGTARIALGSSLGQEPRATKSLAGNELVRGLRTILGLVLVSFTFACAGEAKSTATDASTGDAATDEPIDHRYAVAVVLASSTTRPVGFDLDDDGAVDDAFGTLVTSLGDLGLDLTTLINDTLALGDHALLARFTTRDDRGTLTLREGRAEGGADFTGHGEFQVTDAEPTRLDGSFVPDAPFVTETDALTLRFPFGDGLLALPLTRVRIEAELPFDEAMINLGGALSERELVTLVDTIAASFDARIAATPGCPDACEDETIAMLLAATDADADGRMSGAELRTHPVLGEWLAPDLDLDRDGRADHFSFGVLAFLRAARFDESTPVSSSSSALVPKADFCAVTCDATDCRGCQSTACGWCEGQGCMPRSRARECDAEAWIDNQLFCPSCNHTSQSACDRDGFCGWSTTCGRCVNDTRCSEIPTECTDLRDRRGCR